MKSRLFILILFGISGSLSVTAVMAQNREDTTSNQESTFDYWSYDSAVVWRGVQTLLLCNGIFTSERSLDLVKEQEWAYVKGRPGTVWDEHFEIDESAKMVSVGTKDGVPVMRAAYRKGLGCIMLAPDQDETDITTLPELSLAPLQTDPTQIPWPNGDLIRPSPLPPEVNEEMLAQASDWAFDRPEDRQKTLSLLIIYKGNIIHERYADGVTIHTKTRTWSTAKSIFVTLAGMLADQGKMHLDEPLPIQWLPATRDDSPDPRSRITLRHVLNMSSGLYPVDNGLEYSTGSGLSYWAGASSVKGAKNRGLIREPGSHWDYENYETLLAVKAMKTALGSDNTYLEFPRTALFDKIGMRNTIPGVDRFGDFIFSSQVYTNARDLGRFGLLYLNNGSWNSEQLLSQEWIDFVRTPAPSTESSGNFYGGQWWLVPDNRTDVPSDAYSTAGNRGQYVVVVPSKDLIIVRRGLDFGRQGFSQWDLTREVLKAFN